MYLTLSKRFEFSSSCRYYQPAWSEEKNRAVFGKRAEARYGFGSNFTAHFVFHGPVDPANGMIINVTSIKERINGLLKARYDHKFLNADTPPFSEVVPTPENIAQHLFVEARPLFEDERANLVACHLQESPTNEATAYETGHVERHLWTEFSAARRTYSPHLTDKENEQLFGIAAARSGHGHHYRLRISLAGDIDAQHGMIFPDSDSSVFMDSLRAMFDHRNLSTEVPELRDRPMTTECLAQFIFDRAAGHLPAARIRLWENPWFFIDCDSGDRMQMGVVASFRAAHRLHSPRLSDSQNIDIYDKCNNPAGHGHRYTVEATIPGELDERTGRLHPLDKVNEGVKQALDDWDYRHLDEDTDDFKDRPSTGENIIQVLHRRLEDSLNLPVNRLRLWETPNNRFTLRRTEEVKKA